MKMTTMTRRAVLEGGLGAASLAGLQGCSRTYYPVVKGWENARRTDFVLPRWSWAPRSVRELVEAVARAEREGHRVRMTGSGHSFSDVAINDDWLLSPTSLTGLLPVDTSSLRASAAPETLVRVSGGMRISALNQQLEARNLALGNMGGADIQTYVGAASTGTHGSGLAFGPLASQIVAIQVVKSGGELVHVEPANGVTDASKFTGRLAEEPSLPIRLVQDDDTFHALAVGLGSLGIIYAVVFRAVPKFWLIERRTLSTWEKLSGPDGALTKLMEGKPMCATAAGGDASLCGTDGREPDHVEIYYTPYPSSDGTHTALLTERWRTTTEPARVGAPRGSAIFTPGSDLTVLADKFGLFEDVFAHATTAGLRKFHQTSLENMRQEYYANISYDVFTIGVLNSVNAYGIELAFRLDQTKDAVQRQFQIAAELADRGIHHSAPLSLRFVAPSAAHLAMQHGQKTTMMEMGLLVGLPGAEELLHSHEDVFIREFMARPHWGLDRNVLRNVDGIKRLYPSWDKWKAVYDTMNHSGVFDGRFTDRIGISRRPV